VDENDRGVIKALLRHVTEGTENNNENIKLAGVSVERRTDSSLVELDKRKACFCPYVTWWLRNFDIWIFVFVI
jgi:hypothetical protein